MKKYPRQKNRVVQSLNMRAYFQTFAFGAIAGAAAPRLPFAFPTLDSPRCSSYLCFLSFVQQQAASPLAHPWLGPLSIRRTNSKLVYSNSPNLLQATVRLPMQEDKTALAAPTGLSP